MREKRGQVTVFVIIGIVVVAAVGIALYLSRGPSDGVSEEVSLPLEVRDIYSYISSCVERTANEALQVIGMQGGYIEVEDELPSNIINKFTSSLEILNSGSNVAYWYYEKSNGIRVSNVPTLANIQRQIESYIDENLKKCSDLTRFENHGYIFNAANVVSEVEIGDEKTIVNINYPVKVYFKGSEFDIQNFRTTINSNFGRLYKVARAVYDSEERNMFLENKTLDFMVVYDEVPYSGVDFSCSPRTWVKSNVETDMKKILSKNIPYIKVPGGNYEIPNEYFAVEDLSVDKDTDVNFNYNENWPFYMNVVGHEGDAILRGEPYTTESDLSKFLLPIFCLNQYNFVYDIKYPVLISLTKGDDLFQFAYQVIIENNQPRNMVFAPEEIEFVEDSPICDAKQDKVSIYTLEKDSSNNFVPLGNADVSLQCVNAICKIGISNERGVLDVEMPSCINGILKAKKEGYNDGEELVSFTGDGSLSVVLDKIFERDIEVFVVDQNPRGLSISEQAYITFENLDNGYTTSVVYPGVEKVSLLAGNYHITSYLLLSSQRGIEIEDKKIKVCTDVPKEGALGIFGFTEKKCTEQKIDGTTLQEVMVGGNDFEFEISTRDLADSSKMLFYVDYAGIPLNYNQITNINEKIKKIKPTLPRFANED